MIFSRLDVFMSSSVPSRLGIALKNQMWTTGAASSMCPMRLRRTRRVRHLDAAAVADHALVLHAAVFAAGAFPVLFRAENPLAEQAVLFGPIGAVVDRLRLLDFAERPGPDVVRAGQADPHGAVVVDAVVGGFARQCS